MSYTTLIDAGALATLAAGPSKPASRQSEPHQEPFSPSLPLVIVDCRYKLEEETWGHREYLAGHIPGAVYAHLGHDLAGPRTGRNGRHPLPAADELACTFGHWGITDGVQVVAYDQDTGMYASRLWWLLRWLGHDSAAVLDGGLAAWLAAGNATTSGEERNAGRPFNGMPRPGLTLNADDVASVAGRPDWRLLDARAPERYRGDEEPLDRIAGHIPGAVNHFFKWNLDQRSGFKASGALSDGLRAAIGDVPPDHVISYCGSGVTACHNLLALEHAGIHGARLYAGSWSEWSSDPSRPVERGDPARQSERADPARQSKRGDPTSRPGHRS
jgi:thiosulfate/3-mercaptopyruvate sulfurtransferase